MLGWDLRYWMMGLPVNLEHSLYTLNHEWNEPYELLNRFWLVMSGVDGIELMWGLDGARCRLEW